MNLKPEQLAIGLECVSFLFVTIELYGKGRLRRLDRRVKFVLGAIRNVDVEQKIADLSSLKSAKAKVTFGLLFILILSSSAWGSGTFLWQQNLGDLFWILIVVALVLCAAAAYAGTMFLYYIFLLLLLYLERVTDVMMDLCLLMFKLFRLDGAMLITGTSLFFFSKVI